MAIAKIIILEGPDAAGKSTLANWLHDNHSHQIIHTGPPAPNVNVTVTYLDALNAAVASPGLTVFDRLHLGERIYGPLLRDIDRMGYEGLAAVERVIARRGVKLVICCPPWDVLVTKWRSKDDLLKTEGMLHAVHECYLDEAKRLGLEMYDWTAPNAAEVLKGLIEV